MTEQLHVLEEKTRAERDGLLDRLHSMTTESTTVRLENQSLKVSLKATWESLKTACLILRDKSWGKWHEKMKGGGDKIQKQSQIWDL